MQEIISGKMPYYTRPKEPQVIMAIINYKLPTMPEVGRVKGGLFDLLWECCNQCWSRKPADRPTIQKVKASFKVN